MSADPVSEPMRRTDDNVLGRLAAIDHRPHQTSTQLTTMGKSRNPLDKICVNLSTGCSWTIRLASAGLVTDVPLETLHSQRERGRLHAQGRRTDDCSDCTLLVIHEADSAWAIHGLGAPGVRLPKAEMITLAEKILERAR
jgi:hypothetical protein